jgi:glutathione S-transferase
VSNASGLVVWGVGTARTVRVHWALQELGIPYETRPITSRSGETNSAEYALLNPRRKIPLLQDGKFTIGESAAIVAYLSRMYGSSRIGLIPQNPQDYAAWLEWCFFSVMELDAASLYVIRRHGAAGLGHVYGFAPEVCERAAEYFVQQLRHVDVTLSDGRPFLLGDHFTSADILLTTCLEGALAYDITLCDNAYPYLDRIRLRPGYKRGHEANAMPAAN